MRKKDVPDAELAAQAQAGDRQAFGQLVERYAAQARRVARAVLSDPDDADDAAQDGFLAALRHLGRYDPARPFGPWMMRIVANAAADRRRRLKVRRTEELSPLAASASPGPAEITDRRALQAAFEAALAGLPERQRVAVVLFDVEGYSHAEIARILGVPEGTVRSDVFHARRGLREPLAAWRAWKERDR
jgi:RNA polymerase sigma-70 factor (ECF subfamily)